jgi:hypothetical protein
LFLCGGYDIGSLIGKIEMNLVDSVIDYMKTLSNIMLKALSLAIIMVKAMANQKIEMPILGWIEKTFIDPSKSTSLLEACSLLIAMPTTISYKVLVHKAPQACGLSN